MSKTLEQIREESVERMKSLGAHMTTGDRGFGHFCHLLDGLRETGAIDDLVFSFLQENLQGFAARLAEEHPELFSLQNMDEYRQALEAEQNGLNEEFIAEGLITEADVKEGASAICDALNRARAN